MTIKIDKDLKKRAQATAKELGLPLSTIINAYLREMTIAGRVSFETKKALRRDDIGWGPMSGRETAIASESALDDWNSPEEDKAWAHLQ